MEKLEFIDNETLEEAVRRLIEAREEGKHVYFEFMGQTLTSDDITMENAYQRICGCSKEEYDAKRHLGKEEYFAWADKQNNNPYTITRRNAIKDVINRNNLFVTRNGSYVGYNAEAYLGGLAKYSVFCLPSERSAWEETVRNCLNSVGRVEPVKVDLQLLVYETAGFVMQCLYNGLPLDAMREYTFSNIHDDDGLALFRKVILRFCSRGVEFIRSFRSNTQTVEELESVAAYERTMRMPNRTDKQ